MSAWINHVKKVAKAKGISYSEALSVAGKSYKGKKASSKSAPKSKSKGRSAAHLRSFQKRAAAAMRLHHSKGISLKAAWKRV
jgi:hypothetical protein